MSSLPGRSLEAFLMWKYDLLVEGLPDANSSQRILEAMGKPSERLKLTAREFRPLIDLYSNDRDEIETALNHFNEEEQSWRDYAGFSFYFTDKYDEAVKMYLSMVKSLHANTSYAFGVKLRPTIAGELCTIIKTHFGEPVDDLPANAMPATTDERDMFEHITMLHTIINKGIPPHIIEQPPIDAVTLLGYDMVEDGRHYSGKDFFGYGETCKQNPRLQTVTRMHKTDKWVKLSIYFDGKEVATYDDVRGMSVEDIWLPILPSINQPIVLTGLDRLLLEMVPRDYAKDCPVRRLFSYGTLRRLRDRGLIEAKDAHYRKSALIADAPSVDGWRIQCGR